MLLEENRAIGWGLYDWVSLEYLTLSRVHADPPEIHHLWFREPGAQVPLAVSAHDSAPGSQDDLCSPVSPVLIAGVCHVLLSLTDPRKSG